MIQIIPSDQRPSIEPRQDKVVTEVKEITGAMPAKPVQERTLPPLVLQQHVQHEYTPGTDEQPERRHLDVQQEERRTYCRRINHQPVLEELRSSVERRRHNQRGTDMKEHIDEEV